MKQHALQRLSGIGKRLWCILALGLGLILTAAPAPALYKRGLAWPTAADGTTTIPICFQFSGDYTRAEDELLRQLVRESLAATWERWTLIRFTGYDDCANPPGNAFLAIKLTDFNPAGERQVGGAGDIPDQSVHHSGLRGFQGAGTPNYGWMQIQGVPERHARAVINHEVGHALSFEHEQSRPDAVATCPFGDSILDGGTILAGEYDDTGVMNYCLPYDFGFLSYMDIKGSQTLYGVSQAGQWLWALPALSHTLMR